MKWNNYLFTQLIFTQNQIKKNKKLSREYIRERNYKSFNKKSLNPMDSFEILKKEENVLANENKLFFDLYTKTKKLYPTKIDETFKDLISQYNNNNYKIPDLSDKKNLFNQNPLLLEGSNLQRYYKGMNILNKTNNEIRRKKHINFIKKEMFMLENIAYSRSNKHYGKDLELVEKYKNINSYKIDKKKKPEINYFHIDNVWDKIEAEKTRIKKEKINKKRLKLIKLTKNQKNLKMDLAVENSNKNENSSIKNIDNDKLNSIRTLTSYKNNFSNTINNSIKDYNSKDNITSKNSINISTDYKNSSNRNFQAYNTVKTNKSFDPSKKIKYRLLRDEEKNKLLKEIEEIKSAINNKDLMASELKINEYKNKKNNQKSQHKTVNISNVFNKLLRNFKIRDKSKNKSFKYNYELKGPMFLHLFGQRAIKQSIIKKLIKEDNPQKIKEDYMKLKWDLFNRNEIEKLIEIYYQKILGYGKESIDKIINLKLSDDLIFELMDKYLKIPKDKSIQNSSNPKINKSLNKANNDIKNLKKRFLLGKTLEIFE